MERNLRRLGLTTCITVGFWMLCPGGEAGEGKKPLPAPLGLHVADWTLRRSDDGRPWISFKCISAWSPPTREKRKM
jgi:hypothetical protein